MNKNDRADCPSSSSLDRLVDCSASHNMGLLARSWDQNEDKGDDAEFGIRVHKALQEGSAKSLETDDERNAFSAMFRQQQKAIQYWKSLWHTFLGQEDEELLEHRMWLHYGVTPVFTGQADYILITGTHALILDYKSLWNKVAEPKDNHQLRSLALLLWLTRKELTDITIQIISPHYGYTSHRMLLPDLRAYQEFLKGVLKLVNHASTPVPGEHCKYCRGLLICPAVRKKASHFLKADEDGSLPARLPKGELASQVLDEMTALSALIDKVREHYKTVLAENPKAIPGWQLSTKEIRKFRDAQNVFRMLHGKLGNEVFDLISISVPKALGKVNTIEQQTLQEFIETTTSAPSLRKKGNGNEH